MAALLYSGADLLFPWGTKLFFDEVLTQKKGSLIPLLTLMLFGAVAARLFFSFAKNFLAYRAAEKFALFLKAKLSDHLLLLSVPYIEKNSSGHLVNLFVHDVDCVKRFFAESLSQFFFSSLYVLVLVGFLFWLDPYLAFYSTLFIPLAAYGFFWVNRGEKKDLRDLKEIQGIWMNRLQGILQSIKTVVGFRKEKFEKKRLFRFWKESFGLAMSSNRRNALFAAFGEALSTIGLVILLALGTYAVLSDRLTIGGLLAFYLVFAYLFVPIGRMVSLQETFKEASTSFVRIETFLKVCPSKSTQFAKKIKLKNWKGDLEFKNVSFGYTPLRPVLNKVSFQIEPGEKVALVGKSGAGKSTIVRLLCRFDFPSLGQILVGGQDLHALDYSSYATHLGLVFQEDDLWEETVRDNILYGNPKATSSQLEKAISMAGIHRLLEQLPQGLQTVVGEKGILLSGGQRKRIAIARAFVKDPVFLVMDEVSASLDSESEREVQAAMRNLMRGRTTLMIAHRLSTVCQADRVLVLHQGNLAEMGTPEELIAGGKIFCELFQDQMKYLVSG